MTDGIKRRNVIREMQKRTIGEALYSKKDRQEAERKR